MTDRASLGQNPILAGATAAPVMDGIGRRAGETDVPPCGTSGAVVRGNNGEGAPPVDYHPLEPPILTLSIVVLQFDINFRVHFE